ncbi:MAG TPA: DUF1549 and DUF1553 domain-containing protein [Verrucomicrobiota bacterium]|nr:DUF1549 and DUF1553 domain-containing protein [Verrucomicrobiota bacterium]
MLPGLFQSYGRSAVLLIGLTLTLGASLAAPLRGQSFEQARQHWAYQPLRVVSPPPVQASSRVQTPVDSFLLARLEARGGTFAPPADPRTLLRRVYYDLIGLPPSFDEIESFNRDPSPAALAAIVDRLLASPRYGECWGRHWLDVARYADTKDLVLLYGKDAVRPYAYTYRDYVIRAFNEDLPFDQFIRDQLAADLETPKVPPWRLAALGFLTLGRLFDNNPHDQIDDQIDTVSRGLLGLTVACARCHDHKYDAISSADYYGLYGVFASTERPYVLPLIEDPSDVEGGAQFEEQLAKAKQELESHLDTEFAKLTENLRQRLGDYLVRAATTQPDLTETAQFGLSLTPEDFRPSLMMRTRRLIEQRANLSDRVFGPWALLLNQAGEGFTNASPPVTVPPGREWNPLVVDALNRAALTNRASVARVYGDVFHQVYERSRQPAAGTPQGPLTADEQELLTVVIGPESPVAFPRRDTPNHMSRPEKDRYGGLVQNLDKLAAHATNRPPARAMVVADLAEPFAPRIFVRGSPARPGQAVPRGFLRVLNDGKEKPFGVGSGRLELAEAITAPTNPLTARVFVNRVWLHHFDEPLVASPADFGVRSEPPTNPELLDWLAGEFIRSGWSVKHLHRVIVLSAAYAQGSRATPPRSTDPGASTETNDRPLPFDHYARRRIDLEAMRDTLLFVSGRMDFTLGGLPQNATGDPLNARRTVYGLVDRQNLPGLYRAFDFAAPDQCVERRPKTTVPQQALFALNAPFVQQQATALAELPEIANESDPDRRVTALFRRVLGRNPSPSEIARSRAFLEAAAKDTDTQLSPWAQLGQVLLASNEAVFLD